MELEIYKHIVKEASPYSSTFELPGTIHYFIRNSERSDALHIILPKGETWSLETLGSALYSLHFNQKKPEPTSFLDLLLLTGITKSQIEYIYTNIDFDKHTISIQSRNDVAFGTITTASAVSSWSTSSGSNICVVSTSTGSSYSSGPHTITMNV